MGVETQRGKGNLIRHPVLAVVLSLSITACLQAAGRRSPSRHVPNEIIIRLRADQPGQATGADERAKRLEKLGARWPIRQVNALARHRGRRRDRAGAGRPDLTRVYRVRLDERADVSVEDVLASYRAQADVEYAELNPIVSICAQPDDPQYGSQWALQKIAAAEAWDTCRGSAAVVVAVIDTGVDYRHRDLEANAWRNRAEFNGAPGVDDDGNGFIDDLWGYNFIYNDNEPMDDHGHGTHCAGTIAAVGNNGLDVSGICWNARIMPIKILGDDGDGNAADAALAVYYAVANGAHVISASWGGPEPSELLEEALAYARSRNVVIVGAAGNEDTDETFYPAGYPQVIAVAATDASDKRWASSNYGPWVDVAAPGHDIVSLRAAGVASGYTPNPFTSELSGTSMATPHVSGTVALLLAANPLLTTDEIRHILLSTGDPIAAGICASNTRLNVAQTMARTVPAQGTIRFDRAVYAQGSDIEVLLADWHLRGAAAQTVVIDTATGDSETVTLTETASALGVFRATLSSELAPAMPGDGRIQLTDGQQMVVRYRDADDGSGNVVEWTSAQAHMDAQPPAAVQVDIEMVGPLARIEVLTSEPATAQIRYGPLADSELQFTTDASELGELHRIKLGRLTSGIEYQFVVDLLDAAGNEATADNGGARYTFLADVDRDGFRVPETYPTIQAAIDDAWDGDTVWVADGTYSGPGNVEIDLQGKAVTLRSENGPQACIIDCNGRGGGLYAHSGETRKTVVEGFTITNGNSDFGAGMLCIASSPTIRNCIFTANQATRYGAGLCNYYGADPLVVDCLFKRNTCTSADGRGGGMANRRGSSPTVQNCTFIDNDAAYVGGGMENHDESHLRVLDSVFENNSAGTRGGAVYNANGSRPIFKRCLFSRNTGQFGGAVYNRDHCTVAVEHSIFSDNQASNTGAALGNFQSLVTLTHCTVAANRADLTCGGIDAGRRGDVHLHNCIVWGNTDRSTHTREGPTEQAQITRDSSHVTVNYSCIQDWADTLPGIGTFDRDPLFAGPSNGDFHLLSTAGRWNPALGRWDYDTVNSPCIDAGNPGWPLRDEPLALPDDPDAPATNTRVNMGAYGGTSEASLPPPGWMLDADLTNDGAVDLRDLMDMTAAWLHTGSKQPGDLSHDGIIDAADLARLAHQWRHHATAQTR